MISVRYDNDTREYKGLPTVWRELLDMPLENSKEELKITNEWDPTIAPVKPTYRILLKI